MQWKGTEFFSLGLVVELIIRINSNHYIVCPEQNNFVITFKVQLSRNKKNHRLYGSSH